MIADSHKNLNALTLIQQGVLSAKSIIIASFALCGFANFSFPGRDTFIRLS